MGRNAGRKFAKIGFVFAIFASSLAYAQLASGPQVLTFLSQIDDSDQPYGLYLPRNFDPARKYPLVISLHGANSNHRLNLRRVFGKSNLPGETDAEASRYFPALKDVEFLVSTPFARGTMGYQGIGERDVYDVLADVKRRFRIDEDRVYLTGLSMGGGGALWLALTRPDIWAAVAAVCPSVPPGVEELAGNALNLPVQLFQGEMDPVVPAASVREWHKRLLDLDTRVEYIEYPGVRHNSWDSAYKDGAIFDWFAPYPRNRYPDRVRFATDRYQYNSAYWIQVDGLIPGTLARIDARVKARNQLQVTTSGSLVGFTVTLSGHPLYTAAQPLTLSIDGKPVKMARGKGSFSFSKAGGSWAAGRYVVPAGWKRRGAEGPAAEVISGRHAYVYGTLAAPDEDEIQRRRDVAAQGAEWSTPRLKLALTNRVAADRDMKDAELRESSVVLFGTKETNALIQRLSAGAPLELNPGAADYGLVFVMPFGEKTAVINSGLPWWTGRDRVKRLGLPYLTGPYAVLQSFGDFVLFKGSLEDIVAEGRFGPDWTVPREAAARMRATGAVIVRKSL
jgi:pimeloyl-ACP methyl ester carboxylesterase